MKIPINSTLLQRRGKAYECYSPTIVGRLTKLLGQNNDSPLEVLKNTAGLSSIECGVLHRMYHNDIGGGDGTGKDI